MTVPSPHVQPQRSKHEIARDPVELDLFARIEGLVGEEEALLKIPARERSREQHDRLGAIARELDRIFDRLRERADRIARASGGGGQPAPR